MISICVVVTTFKHEKYIAQCLDGILMQEYDYPFKIIVGEDCSPDSTRKILNDYEQRYPERIFPIYFDKNVGGGVNFLTCLSKVDTEWVAWCEGDDFWIDAQKLKKQSMLLEKEKNAVICFSKAKIFNESDPTQIKNDWGFPDWFSKNIYKRSHFGLANFIPTCTVIYKMSAIMPTPKYYLDWHLGDWTLHLHALRKGDAVYLNEATACYRIHSGGAWQGQPLYINYEKNEKLLKFLISIEASSDVVSSLYAGLFISQYLLLYFDLMGRDFKKARSRIVPIITSSFKMSWNYLVLRYFINMNYNRLKRLVLETLNLKKKNSNVGIVL